MNWIKKNIINIILVGVSIILTLIAVDFALHFTRYRYPIYRLNYPQGYFVKDLELGYNIAENFATSTHYFRDDAFTIWSNNIGCFDTNYDGETPYIYLAGDSLTWSFAPFEDTWGRKIETNVGMRTVKCGVVGYGTKAELIKAERNFARFGHPNLIVVGYTAYNDFADDANFPQNTSHNGFLVPSLARGGVTEVEVEQRYDNFDKYCSLNIPKSPIIARIRCFMTTNSILFNIFKTDLRNKIDTLFPSFVDKLEGQGFLAEQHGFDVETTDLEYQKHLDNILNFKKTAQREGSNLLFILAPYDNTRVIPFLEKEHIPYIDLNPIFDKYKKIKPLIWPKDGHYNISGNHLVGLIVAKFIIENNFVLVPDKAERLKTIDTEMDKEFNN